METDRELTLKRLPGGEYLLFANDGERICVLPLRAEAGIEARIAADPAEWRRRVLDYDREREARAVREKRNALLRQTDALFAADRLMRNEQPDGERIHALCSGPLARYRQALRDLPAQEGFPYRVEFPQRPT